MTKLFGTVGALVFSSVAGWLTAPLGMMTAFMVSTVAGGVGIYVGKKFADRLTD